MLECALAVGCMRNCKYFCMILLYMVLPLRVDYYWNTAIAAYSGTSCSRKLRTNIGWQALDTVFVHCLLSGSPTVIIQIYLDKFIHIMWCQWWSQKLKRGSSMLSMEQEHVDSLVFCLAFSLGGVGCLLCSRLEVLLIKYEISYGTFWPLWLWSCVVGIACYTVHFTCVSDW